MTVLKTTLWKNLIIHGLLAKKVKKYLYKKYSPNINTNATQYKVSCFKQNYVGKFFD